MRIGVLKEIKTKEYRVAVTPEGVEQMREHGHEVFVEVDYWKLKANSSKTKVIIFGNRRTKVGTAKYIFNGSELEIIDNFKYLGVLFNFNGNFHKCKKHLYDQTCTNSYVLFAQKMQETPI